MQFWGSLKHSTGLNGRDAFSIGEGPGEVMHTHYTHIYGKMDSQREFCLLWRRNGKGLSSKFTPPSTTYIMHRSKFSGMYVRAPLGLERQMLLSIFLLLCGLLHMKITSWLLRSDWVDSAANILHLLHLATLLMPADFHDVHQRTRQKPRPLTSHMSSLLLGYDWTPWRVSIIEHSVTSRNLGKGWGSDHKLPALSFPQHDDRSCIYQYVLMGTMSLPISRSPRAAKIRVLWAGEYNIQEIGADRNQGFIEEKRERETLLRLEKWL